MIDGVLKTLRSQINFGQTQPLTPVPQANLSQQQQQAQRSVRDFANEAGQLITALRQEERYSTYISSLLGDALRVKATADVLASRSLGIRDVTQLASEYSQLDQQWRLLSHQLSQTANLSATVRQRVARLNQVNQELEQQLKLSPQMDNTELVYYFSAIGEHLDNLAEDVQIDLYTHPQRDRFATGIQQLRTRSQQLRLAVEYNYPYDAVKRYYEQFHSDWLSIKGELRPINNRYIQRNISRITQIGDRIHELLWLSPVIDGRDILQQAEALQQQVDGIGNTVSLTQVMRLPNAEEFFGRAKEFYELCGTFRQTVATETELENVWWDFRVLDVAWTDLEGADAHHEFGRDAECGGH